MKHLEKMQGLLALGFALIILFFILQYSNIGSLDFCGFGVDSLGRIYVGRFHTIEVHNNGELVNTIPSPLNRGWGFTVTNADQILVTNGYYLYTLDLNGTVIQTGHDDNSKLMWELERTKSTNDIHGNIYKLRGFLGHKWITKNGEEVYSLPFGDVITKLSFFFGCASFAIGLVAVEICRKRKAFDKTENRPQPFYGG